MNYDIIGNIGFFYFITGVTGAELVSQLRALEDICSWGAVGDEGREESHYFDIEKAILSQKSVP